MQNHQQVHQLQKSYGALLKTKIPSAPHILLLKRRDYVRATILGDWEGLAKVAARHRKKAEAGFRKLHQIQEDLHALSNKVNALLADAKAAWKPLEDRDDWPEIKEKIEQKVEGDTTPAEVTAHANKLGALRFSEMANRILDPLRNKAANLDETNESWEALLAGASLAQAIAKFNRHRNAETGQVLKLNAWLKRTQATLRKHEKAVWQALRARDLRRIAAVSRSMLQWTSDDAFDEAVKKAAALALARKATVDSRWSLGDQAVAVGELIRSLLLGRVLARHTAWMSGTELGALKHWCDAADRLPFPSKWSPPTSVDLAEIWSRPRRYSGKSVTVEGVVGPIVNRHVRRKVFSSAWITSADGTSMRIGILHIKLDSGGIAEGAYVKASGIFIPDDEEFGTSIIRIDQRALTEDSKQSWSDWKDLKLRRYFTPVAHGLTVRWSWERGEIGSGNQLRYGTWRPFGIGD